jgi:arsenical pump membrane protein
MGPIALFIAILFCILFCSKYIPISISSIVGASIALILGFITIQNVYTTLEFVLNPTITLILIVMISLILKNIGLFDYIALKLIGYSKKSTLRLYIIITIFGAFLATFFTNDGAILILTPIVLSKFKYIKLSKRAMIAFVMAVGFIADTSSLTFTISNLTNIMAAEYIPITFNDFFAIMWPINCISTIVSLAMLLILFKKDLSKPMEWQKNLESQEAVCDKGLIILSLILLPFLFITFFVASKALIPTALILLPFTIILLIAALVKKNITLLEIVKRTPFNIIGFSLGMYILVYAIEPTTLFAYTSAQIQKLHAIGDRTYFFFNGLFVGIISCFFNNLAAFLYSLLYTDTLHLTTHMKKLATMSSLIGANIGPKMSPIGSLATLLWLHILEKGKLPISWGYYTKMGIVLTIPTLLITLLVFSLLYA